MILTPLWDQVITNFIKSNNQAIKNFITDHLKWTPHVWEGAGKHLRAKHDGLKSHPPRQRLLLSWPSGCSLILINDDWSVNKNSEVVLKIYTVELEIESVSGKMRRVLAQAFKLIKRMSRNQSRLAEFNTALKFFRITDQWHIVAIKFPFGRNRDFLALLLLPLTGGPKDWKRFDADWRLISSASASFHTNSDNCERNTQKWNSNNYLHANCSSLVTLRWRHIHRLTQRRNRRFLRTP